MKRLFISHAEKDEEITSAFVDLLFHIGLSEKNIFCSSISELGVPVKEDIYSYLRDILDSDDVIPVFMLSSNYYASAACLNEMGAVWLKQRKYYTFLLPGFTFKEIRGAINPSVRGIKLDNARLRDDLNQFKEDIRKEFKLKRISENRWEKYRDSFIEDVQAFSLSKEIVFDIKENNTYCIGKINRGACESVVDKLCNKLDFRFDFNKTDSELCSLVLFAGEVNLQKEFKSGRYLDFWIKASDEVDKVTVEIHLSSMNPSKTIDVGREWKRHSIPLDEFTNLEQLWKCCKEICFVVDRKFVERGVIEVKDIKIL